MRLVASCGDLYCIEPTHRVAVPSPPRAPRKPRAPKERPEDDPMLMRLYRLHLDGASLLDLAKEWGIPWPDLRRAVKAIAKSSRV